MHLHLSIEKGPRNLSDLTCFENLKTLVLEYPIEDVTIIETNAPTVFLRGYERRADKSKLNNVKLNGIRSLTLDRMTHETTSLPPLPSAETIRFTTNGFRFERGVDPFPDHRNVRLLDLSDNPIVTIPNGVFKAVPKLGVLILQDTALEHFGDTAFCDLQWPRAVNFGKRLPERTSVRMLPENPDKPWNTLRCLIDKEIESNVLYESDICDCKNLDYHYVPRWVRPFSYTSEGIICSNREPRGLFEFYERFCYKWSRRMRKSPVPVFRRNHTYRIPVCENKILQGVLLFLWIAYALFCWIPPIVLFKLHCAAFRKQLIHDQLTCRPKNLFIICPRHARQWCKKVIVPCLEADLFVNKAPKLRRLRTDHSVKETDRTKQNSADQMTKTEQNVNSSDSENKRMNSNNLTKPSGLINSFSQRTVTSVSTGINAPQGPWAWQPRYLCHVAPPARHRLSTMMESCQVVIIFPSASLFSEPACRAQIRLAFHLTRLNRIPPPAIIVWPVTLTRSAVPANHRLVNRSKKLLDEDKYYTAPRFDSIRNDPEDPAETAIIKAKVPTRDEAIEILQYFATLTSPCVHWSNMKTVRENLEPLVWWMNKASQIPAY